MAFQIKEAPESRQVNSSREGYVVTRTYIAWSDATADEGVLLDTEALSQDPIIESLGDAHPTIDNLVIKDIEISVNTQTLNRGYIVYSYGRIDRAGNQGGGVSTPDANGEMWTFNMVSQTTHINAVLNDINGKPQQYTYDGATPRGVQKFTAINFDDETVTGADVYRPAEAVNVTKIYPDYTDVNQSYRKTLRSLRNTVNNATWPNGSEFSAGELLFLGADISYNLAEGSATVNYSFLAGDTQKKQKYTVWAKDATESTETTVVELPKVYPFQILWAPIDRRQVPVSGGKSKTVLHVKSLNVADVYRYGDFSQLKIGGD